MEELRNNPASEPERAEAGETGLMDIFIKLLIHWKQILLVVVIFAAIGVVAALRMSRYWSVSVTLAPESQSQSSGSLGSLALMRRFTNIPMAGTTDAMDVTIFPDICASTPFLAALLDVPLTSYVSDEDRMEGKVPVQTTVYKHITGLDGMRKRRFSLMSLIKPLLTKKSYSAPYTGVKDPTELPKVASEVVNALRRFIEVTVDRTTFVTTIRVVFDDPMMAKQLADTVCSRLQDYVTEYRTSKAQADYEYYVILTDEARADMVKAQSAYAAAVDYDRSAILQSAAAEKDRLRAEANLTGQLYSSMVQQREQAKAKIQEERPVYAVIQPAVLPQKPANSRKRKVLLWAFAGGVLACGWYGLGKDFYLRVKKDIKERMA